MSDFLERRKDAPLPLISGPQTREYEAIADRIASDSPGRLLDWGCGWGQVSKMLLDRGVDVTSFEYRDGYDGTGSERLEKVPQIRPARAPRPRPGGARESPRGRGRRERRPGEAALRRRVLRHRPQLRRARARR